MEENLCVIVNNVLLTGCGGSSDSDNLANTLSPTPIPSPVPDNEADTYDMSRVLSGTWYGLSGSGTATGSDGRYRLEMVRTRARISRVEIEGETGTALLTGYQDWRAIHSSMEYASVVRLESMQDEMALVHIGSNMWRMEYPDGLDYSATLTIKLTSNRTGEATPTGVVDIEGYLYSYTMNMELRE